MAASRMSAREQAGLLLEAWERRDYAALESDAEECLRLEDEAMDSALERERRELLGSLARELKQAAAARAPRQDVEVCVSLLRHLRNQAW